MTQVPTHFDDAAINSIVDLANAIDCIRQVDGTSHLILPEGYSHVDLTKLIERVQPTQDRKKGTTTLSDIDSFILFAIQQSHEAHGYIYADPEAMTLTAVFNDHRDLDTAGWRDFRAVYHAELSLEFSTWKRNDRKVMEQEDFAVFLEDNIADVVEPSGDALLAIALSLQAKTEASFSSARRLDNGQVQFSYTENIEARSGTGAIDIPREFQIGLRMFKNGDGYKIKARLKYRLGSGKLKFWYELDRPETAIESAFKEYIVKAEAAGYTVLIGKP
jgi:uncharacterized protein YfdQ (DUF2303 family)